MQGPSASPPIDEQANTSIVPATQNAPGQTSTGILSDDDESVYEVSKCLSVQCTVHCTHGLHEFNVSIDL